MLKTKNGHKLVNGRFLFFKEFLKHPLQIGSIVPSSRFLERRIMEGAGIASAKTVVELGGGTGGTTRAILRAMPENATLLSIEINPHFHRLVGGIEDPRLIAHMGSACDLEDILAMYGLESPDVIISGIPFSTMSLELGNRVLETVSNSLAPHGRFVAYQVRGRVAALSRPFLGQEQSAMEFRNFPPMRVFHWEKKNGQKVE